MNKIKDGNTSLKEPTITTFKSSLKFFAWGVLGMGICIFVFQFLLGVSERNADLGIVGEDDPMAPVVTVLLIATPMIFVASAGSLFAPIYFCMMQLGKYVKFAYKGTQTFTDTLWVTVGLFLQLGCVLLLGALGWIAVTSYI